MIYRTEYPPAVDRILYSRRVQRARHKTSQGDSSVTGTKYVAHGLPLHTSRYSVTNKCVLDVSRALISNLLCSTNYGNQ